VIDLHCHLLPGIDDGPPTMAAAMDLARAQVAAGVDTVVATPHVSWEYPNTADVIERGVEEVRDALASEGIPLRVESGAEIAITTAMELPDEELRRMTIAHESWLLLEAPLSGHAPGFNDLLLRVQGRGFRVLLAHPERCPEIHRNPDLLEQLVDAGVRAQVTSTSLVGVFGRRARHVAFDLLARGLAHNVSSDAHDANRRPPGIQDQLEASGAGETAQWLSSDVPQAVLAGTMLPKCPSEVSAALAAAGAAASAAPDGKRRGLFRRS
jgi:protein-tyrosine phosphatase